MERAEDSGRKVFLGGTFQEEILCLLGQVRGTVGMGGAHSFRKFCLGLTAHSVRRMDITVFSFWLCCFPEGGYYLGISKLCFQEIVDEASLSGSVSLTIL